MKVHFEDRDWELDISDINLKPAMVLQGYMGMSVNKWVESLQDEADADGNITKSAADDPCFLKSIGGLYWLMKQQNGVEYPIGDTDFPVGAFSEAIARAQAEEAAAQAGAFADSESDPTLPPEGSEPSPVPASIPTPPTPGPPGGAGFPDG